MDNMLALHHPLIFSASSSPSPRPSSSSTAQVTKRPKLGKKSNSTSSKHRNVQSSLEAKVEKNRGWNAFFVPLARGTPGAPPSSPVLAARSQGSGLGLGSGEVEHVEHIEHVGQAGFMQAQAFEQVQGVYGAQALTGMGVGVGMRIAERTSRSKSQQAQKRSQSYTHAHALPPVNASFFANSNNITEPASPTASTICDRSDTDLSRETTRSFPSRDEYQKWAEVQWVEHAGMGMGMPPLELGPAGSVVGLGLQRADGGVELGGMGGDIEME